MQSQASNLSSLTLEIEFNFEGYRKEEGEGGDWEEDLAAMAGRQEERHRGKGQVYTCATAFSCVSEQSELAWALGPFVLPPIALRSIFSVMGSARELSSAQCQAVAIRASAMGAGAGCSQFF